MKGARDPFWDAVKGIGYCCVLIGHMDLSKYIFNFHMPLFFIVSGMFFLRNAGLRRVVRNVAVPWLYFTVICTVLSCIFSGHIDVAYLMRSSFLGRPYVCNSLWFLTALFGAQVLCLFHQLFKTDKLALLGEFMVCLALGWAAAYLSHRFIGYCPLMLLAIPMSYFFLYDRQSLWGFFSPSSEKGKSEQRCLLFCVRIWSVYVDQRQLWLFKYVLSKV